MEYFCSLADYSVVCYDVDPWAQGQALRVFLSQKCVLPLFCQKFTFDLDQESFSVVAIFLEGRPLGIFVLYNLNFFYAFDQTVCS